MGQVSGETSRVQIIEIQDNQDKSEKTQVGRLSPNDRVRLKPVEGADFPQEVSVRDFIFKDEFKGLGSPSQRTLLLTRKTDLPLGKGIFHYLRAKLSAEAPFPKVYAFSHTPISQLPSCTKEYGRFEVDFTQKNNNPHPYLSNGAMHDGVYENGLMKLGADKFLLGERSYVPRYLQAPQAFFGPNSPKERKISIQCLMNGEIQLSRTVDALEGNSIVPRLYGPRTNFSPKAISRLGLQFTPKDSPLQLASNLRILAWSWITGFSELIK